MFVINANNVNDALTKGYEFLLEYGVRRDSRNGPVLVAPQPVTTRYDKPYQRVLFNDLRDANPFFHLVESLWMIAGRNDLATLTEFVKTFANFSDDGQTVAGAYGYRWRRQFDRDQLAWAIRRLKENPEDRRVVIQMYDADIDQTAADQGGKDIPCNLLALPSVSTDGRLDLTVYNRSNDMVWGAYGANAVHFSMLQELIADQLEIPVGAYYQVANNFHAYLSTFEKASKRDWDPYEEYLVKPYLHPFRGQSLGEITEDLDMFFRNPARVGIRNDFLRRIARPMVMAHRAYRKKDFDGAMEILDQMPRRNDWALAAVNWIEKRRK